MKNSMLCVLAFLFITGSWITAQDAAQMRGIKAKAWPFIVYRDSMDMANHFIPSGWMGDYSDVTINDRWAINPKAGKTCIQVKYTADQKQNAGWGGIYWQNPANNWGNLKGGYDLSGARQLSFWARGEKGGESIEFKFGGIAGEYPDSAVGTTGTIAVTKDWQQYSIDIASDDLSYVNGGFCVVFSVDNNPAGMTFYIDEIQYLMNPGQAGK
jgi:hypothetical protein